MNHFSRTFQWVPALFSEECTYVYGGKCEAKISMYKQTTTLLSSFGISHHINAIADCLSRTLMCRLVREWVDLKIIFFKGFFNFKSTFQQSASRMGHFDI